MKLFPPDRRAFVRAAAFLLVSLAVAIVSQVPRAHAALTFNVNSLNDTTDALLNGICADASGMCTLRAAIQEANFQPGDDTIQFSVTGTVNLTGALQPISSNISINGPGSGLLTVRRNTGGDYRILLISASTTTISGITIANGRTPDSVGGATAEPGGGILQSGGALTLRDVVLTGNATGNGGANLVSGSSSGGWGGFGGGIHAGGILTMTDCVVSNNTTGNGGTGGGFGGSGGRGAGIYFAPGTLTMKNVLIIGNRTGTSGGPSGGNSGYGGGIWIGGDFFPAQNSSATMTNVTVTNNSTGDNITTDAAGDGGGIHVYQGTVTLTDSTVSGNHTGNGGTLGFGGRGGSGGGILNNGNMTIRNSVVSGNTMGNSQEHSGSEGGGITNLFNLTLLNTTISGNRTGTGPNLGGGIFVRGTTTIINCTITGNSADQDNGNAIAGLNGTTVIANTIIAGNGASANSPDLSQLFFSQSYTSQGHNLIGNADGVTDFNAPGDQTGTGAAPLNPQLGPLADNGGPTLTHALLASSPALDAGDNALAKDLSNIPLATDQRGSGRIADSLDADITATVDIGAYEFHQTLENIPDQSTNEDTPLTLFFSVGDGGPAVNSVTASSTDQAIVSNANLAVSGTGPIRMLQITPTANRSGLTIITVTANYSNGTIINSNFQLNVVPVNDVPAFTKGPNQMILEDAGPQTITNWATGMDAGPNESGQTLSFTVISNNPIFSAAPAISPSGTLTYTVSPNVSGVATLTVTLKDDGGTANGGQDTSVAQTVTITISAVNDAPAFTKGANQTVGEDAGLQVINNWASGITSGPGESDGLTFVVTNNTNANLFSSQPIVTGFGSLIFSPALNATGTADITLVLKDNGGTANGGVDISAPQTFTITVTPVNDAPTVLFRSILQRTRTHRLYFPMQTSTRSLWATLTRAAMRFASR